MCNHLSLSACLWVAFHPCVFLPNGYSCIWISVNFQENIRKGVNFDITLKLNALNLIKKTTLQILSRYADIFEAAYFWACPNGWFSCKKGFRLGFIFDPSMQCQQTTEPTQFSYLIWERPQQTKAHYFRKGLT